MKRDIKKVVKDSLPGNAIVIECKIIKINNRNNVRVIYKIGEEYFTTVLKGNWPDE